MTTISGKLYQMKNAAGTENRFPMTVIEGVYGLATYLQQQFGSLADIYMPIEGIHEAKIGQEFVYRQTPNTIGANLLNIDRIKGKTLAWNQLVSSLHLESGVYNGLTVTNNGDGTYTFNGTTTETFDQRVAYVNVLAGHKYFVRLDIPNVEANFAQVPAFTLDANGRAITTPASSETRLYMTISPGVTLNNVRVTPQVTDLTLLEIDNLTTVEEVEAWLAMNVGLRSYYPFNAGELKSNDAQSIVTEGRNQWDEEWELGSYTITGEKYTRNDAFRCVNKIPIFPSTVYYHNQGFSGIAFYDANGVALDTSTFIFNSLAGTFTTPSDAYFMAFYIAGITTYANNICINLSDASFNGQYEPYWKNTCELNIKTLTGKKDGIGASVTIFPDGAGGVGSVYDELRKSVAYKRCGIRAYQAGDESDSSVITDGTNTIYVLATPETYVLDTPLVTAMRAGTTEERISPNSDGLSAPFCGDLTYSVSSASDALDAQYATAAGKLYNKRKIWGQDFDGTEDVTGLATMGNGAKVSSVLTIPTSAPASGAVASGECALYINPNGNYSQSL